MQGLQKPSKMGHKQDYQYTRDIVCQAFAGEKSVEKIAAVLNRFLPEYEPLNTDYAMKVGEDSSVFGSEEEMIRYFIETPHVDQAFYWNQSKDNPDRIMVGAVITEDNQLIISLTVDGTPDTEAYYFRELKEFLNTKIGVISYIDPACYENGKDFCSRYGME